MALVVLAVSLVAADGIRTVAAPVVAVGALSLTAFTGHSVVVFALQAGGTVHPSLLLFLGLAAVSGRAGGSGDAPVGSVDVCVQALDVVASEDLGDQLGTAAGSDLAE